MGQQSSKPVVGIQGNTGSLGPPGSVGPVGPVGPQGAPGGKGDTGDTGIQGIQGVAGTNAVFNPDLLYTFNKNTTFNETARFNRNISLHPSSVFSIDEPNAPNARLLIDSTGATIGVPFTLKNTLNFNNTMNIKTLNNNLCLFSNNREIACISTQGEVITKQPLCNNLNKCLTVQNNENGSQVKQMDFINNLRTQQWSLDANGRICNWDGKCLSLETNVNTNGVNIIQSTPNTSEGQIWQYDNLGRLYNKWNKYLAVPSDTKNDVTVIQWDGNASNGQKWDFKPPGSMTQAANPEITSFDI